uniref:DEAD/DEAH box helicase domain-containing protein n=1 Tax=Glossina palpalis gambiensis TaxID=67801 RepID=A0A1B0C349_9MUSC
MSRCCYTVTFVTQTCFCGVGNWLRKNISPLLEMLSRRPNESPWIPKEIDAIIISTTRELALQISEVLQVFLTQEQLKHLRQKLIVGGGSIEGDIKPVQNEGATIGTNQHVYYKDLN